MPFVKHARLEVHLLQELLVVCVACGHVVCRDDDVQVRFLLEEVARIGSLRLGAIVREDLQSRGEDIELADPVVEGGRGDNNEMRAGLIGLLEMGNERNDLRRLAETLVNERAMSEHA